MELMELIFDRVNENLPDEAPLLTQQSCFLLAKSAECLQTTRA